MGGGCSKDKQRTDNEGSLFKKAYASAKQADFDKTLRLVQEVSQADAGLPVEETRLLPLLRAQHDDTSGFGLA